MAVAAALGLETGAPTLYLERLRLADGEPLLLEKVHLPADRFPGPPGRDLEHNSLYGILAERYATPVAAPGRRSCRSSCRLARPASSAEPDRLALLVEGVAYTRAGVPVEYARSTSGATGCATTSIGRSPARASRAEVTR